MGDNLHDKYAAGLISSAGLDSLTGSSGHGSFSMMACREKKHNGQNKRERAWELAMQQSANPVKLSSVHAHASCTVADLFSSGVPIFLVPASVVGREPDPRASRVHAERGDDVDSVPLAYRHVTTLTCPAPTYIAE